MDGSGQARRIEDRKEVVLHEGARVAGFTACPAESVLQRCQWTDPAHELDEHSPRGGRGVKPSEPPPPEN